MAPTDATLARDGYELAELPEGFVKTMAAYVSKWGWPEMGTTVKRPIQKVRRCNLTATTNIGGSTATAVIRPSPHIATPV